MWVPFSYSEDQRRFRRTCRDQRRRRHTGSGNGAAAQNEEAALRGRGVQRRDAEATREKVRGRVGDK